MQAVEVEPFLCGGLKAEDPGVDREGGGSPEIMEVSAVDYFSLALPSAQGQAEEPKKCVLTSHVSDRTI